MYTCKDFDKHVYVYNQLWKQLCMSLEDTPALSGVPFNIPTHIKKKTSIIAYSELPDNFKSCLSDALNLTSYSKGTNNSLCILSNIDNLFLNIIDVNDIATLRLLIYTTQSETGTSKYKQDIESDLDNICKSMQTIRTKTIDTIAYEIQYQCKNDNPTILFTDKQLLSDKIHLKDAYQHGDYFIINFVLKGESGIMLKDFLSDLNLIYNQLKTKLKKIIYKPNNYGTTENININLFNISFPLILLNTKVEDVKFSREVKHEIYLKLPKGMAIFNKSLCNNYKRFFNLTITNDFASKENIANIIDYILATHLMYISNAKITIDVNNLVSSEVLYISILKEIARDSATLVLDKDSNILEFQQEVKYDNIY